MKTKNPLLPFFTISDLSELIRNRAVSPVEVTELMLERIDRINPSLNVFITITADLAMKEAHQAETDIMNGKYKGPLHGIPIAHKDLYYTKGIRTTCSSTILKDFIPDYDATAVVKLREAGTIHLGKVQTHEFASGAMTNSPHFGPCLNPWNTDKVPGGSSGGSGAGVAAGLFYMGTGSDTGGSIRIPAACCGVVGMKPTYGRVSRYGIFPMAYSLDHGGPLTRSVRDAALCLEAMAGFDAKDESTSPLPVPVMTGGFTDSLKGVRIGLPTSYYFENVDDEVMIAVQKAIQTMKELGAEFVDVDLKMSDYVRPASSAVLMGEILSIHGPWLSSRPEDYGPDVLAMLKSGTDITAAQYVDAQRARHLITQDYLNALGGVDVLLTPATPTSAPDITDYRQGMRLAELTMPTNLTGLPSLSMPCGFTPEGMPVNLQLIGRPFEEPRVLAIGHAYEINTPWHTMHPEL
ncbi:amidase [Paenibacillus physcomitrellae]|uniref:Amidase n=1 Tax=Paenibacillus physcomitrellae TaxID=1619311 RepID=A0ABQ1GCT0_9BACL|nr:amidase [Paenibacillus physcomitrellae]GGA41114.1 amidase [Paenibacillus physcomitrellae]